MTHDWTYVISFSAQQHHCKGGAGDVIPSSTAASYPSSSSLQFADSVMVASSSAVIHDGVSCGMVSAASNCGGGACAPAVCSNGSHGLSMIKNWLRGQPALAPQLQRVESAATKGAHASQA
ncbi:hypothetical protein E2562_022156 [Oryza meyeriana var. granulata]|uniref:Uncharacterized protein n=1 Tax=Oryza meyeriana var. granulata TaxID=110450 RepID=A0A6G1DMN1_9ORYZ|nr:hypothetical protein E2562_022156 [Oryza meyeriana var. granulata]